MSLQYMSDTLIITPWIHGIQVRDRVTKDEYFLNLDDLRAMYVAIQAHKERKSITREE